MAESESGFMSGGADDMEMDFGGSRASEECSGAGDINMGAMLAHGSKFSRLSLYNRNISRSFEAEFNSVKSYKVKEPIGYALLLYSNQTTESKSELDSVQVDIANMSDVLTRKRWMVTCAPYPLDKPSLMYELHKLNDLAMETELYGEPRLGDYSLFLLYYTGHGNAEGVVLNDGQLVPYAEIVTRVSSIDCLRDKPKIFIFDSCQEKQAMSLHFGNFTTKHPTLESVYQQNKELFKPYPPAHTLLCFSACEGLTSLMDKNEGSYYTLALSHALRQFGDRLSLPEIITQVNGGTKAVVSSSSHGRELQQPMFKSTLEKQLVLSCTCVHVVCVCTCVCVCVCVHACVIMYVCR